MGALAEKSQIKLILMPKNRGEKIAKNMQFKFYLSILLAGGGVIFQLYLTLFWIFEMLSAKDVYLDNGLSPKSANALFSKKQRLNSYRFEKVDGKLYLKTDDYRSPFRDRISQLTYDALCVVGSYYALYKSIEAKSGIPATNIKSLYRSFSFKDPNKALLIIEALKKIKSESLF